MTTLLGTRARGPVRRALAGATTIALIAGGAGALAPAAQAVPSTTASAVVSTSVNPSGSGLSVTLFARVTDTVIPTTQLAGTVTFTDGATVLGTKTLSGGKASLATSKLSPGDHPITATFTDPSAATATSPAITQHVNPGDSTIALSTTAATAYTGQAGKVTATVARVAPAIGVPTGSVDFYDDSYYLYTAPLASGKAVLPFTALTAGVHTITATYTGSPEHNPSSTPTALTQTVLANIPVAGATFTPATVALGGTATLVLSATNTGPTSLTSNVALGVRITLPFTVVNMPPGQLCSARSGLYYCLTSVAKGATSKLTLKVTAPTAPGTYAVSSYAGNTDTGDETYATATLTVQ